MDNAWLWLSQKIWRDARLSPSKVIFWILSLKFLAIELTRRTLTIGYFCSRMVEWIDVDVVVDEGIEGDVEDKWLLTESIDAVRILNFSSVVVLKSDTESQST